MNVQPAQDLREEKPRNPAGQLLKMFREGFLSVCVYRNIAHGIVYYDIVIYRKIRMKENGSRYVRGANLKPDDLPILQNLLRDADQFLSENIRTGARQGS